MNRDLLENHNLVAIDHRLLCKLIDYSKLSDTHAQVKRLIPLICRNLARKEDARVRVGLVKFVGGEFVSGRVWFEVQWREKGASQRAHCLVQQAGRELISLPKPKSKVVNCGRIRNRAKQKPSIGLQVVVIVECAAPF